MEGERVRLLRLDHLDDDGVCVPGDNQLWRTPIDSEGRAAFDERHELMESQRWVETNSVRI